MTARVMRTRSAAVAAALLATVLAGCAQQEAAAPAPATSPATTQHQVRHTEPAGMPRSVPTRLRIPEIDATSSLVRLGLNADGGVEVPPVSEPEQAGWYDKSPTPGEVGPAVVLGHVDGDGKLGIFYDLEQLEPGDDVYVDRRDGTTARFRVREVDRVPKDHFPTDAVYGNTPGPQLRLITCGGAFDEEADSYEDNIIAYANLA